VTGWTRDLDARSEAAVAAAIARCGRLPVLDRSLARVLELIDDEESPTGELVTALESDPALAANVLRYANSAIVGRPIRAGTVRQAVTMVGRRATRDLCLEAVTFRFFESAPGNGGVSRGQLHVHAVTVAATAAAAAELVGLPKELPHLAGLLHDCGKLVMPLAFGEEAMDELAARYPSGAARARAEWERFGVDHAYAGALFAAHSGLDAELVAAVAWHHGGRQGCLTPTPDVACVQLADTVVHMLAGALTDPSMLEATLECLELGPEVLDQLADRITAGGPPDAATALAHRVAELERLAHTDELTGLANRRHWMATVRQQMKAGGGGLLLCDVDRFKEVNDVHGHATGDLVLIEIARILSRHGTAGRLGGDEFAVWIRDHATAEKTADRIIEQIAAAFPDPATLAVSVSIGVAPPTCDDLATALELSDRALYAAKTGGRNRACRAEPIAA
jgi:diguanylate cyclase (GGDEF)-like protein/putative nucleotidyltransferase with HDIG domain